jgi:predicted GNAT superfamily acetyltransferase
MFIVIVSGESRRNIPPIPAVALLRLKQQAFYAEKPGILQIFILLFQRRVQQARPNSQQGCQITHKKN